MTTLYQNAHSPERATVNAFQYLDVIFVVLGASLALIVGAPAFGVIVGGGGWILQRVIQLGDRRFTRKQREAPRQVGVLVVEAFGRIWLLAGAIVVAGTAGNRADGLAAAVLIFAAYSAGFAVRLLSGPPPEREAGRG